MVGCAGRLLAQATPGRGGRIVVAPLDVSERRREREVRRGHHSLAQLRTEAYPVYRDHRYPPSPFAADRHGCDQNVRLIDESKRVLITMNAKAAKTATTEDERKRR